MSIVPIIKTRVWRRIDGIIIKIKVIQTTTAPERYMRNMLTRKTQKNPMKKAHNKDHEHPWTQPWNHEVRNERKGQRQTTCLQSNYAQTLSRKSCWICPNGNFIHCFDLFGICPWHSICSSHGGRELPIYLPDPSTRGEAYILITPTHVCKCNATKVWQQPLLESTPQTQHFMAFWAPASCR